LEWIGNGEVGSWSVVDVLRMSLDEADVNVSGIVEGELISCGVSGGCLSKSLSILILITIK
jgi:hypothetical protein